MAERSFTLSMDEAPEVHSGHRNVVFRTARVFKHEAGVELLGRPPQRGGRTPAYSLGDPEVFKACQYCQPGDTLWLREKFVAHWMNPPYPARSKLVTHQAIRQRDGSFSQATPEKPVQVFYEANGKRDNPGIAPWQPAVHMPRWASRMTTEVVSVDVVQLRGLDGAEGDLAWRITLGPIRSSQTVVGPYVVEWLGYQGEVYREKFDDGPEFYGRVVGTRAGLLFEGHTLEECVNDFRSTVSEWLNDCHARQVDPESFRTTDGSSGWGDA